MERDNIAQLQLPDPSDTDPHPRLILKGRGIHAGESFTALFPDGWHDITLEVSWEQTGRITRFYRNWIGRFPLTKYFNLYDILLESPRKKLKTE